MLEIVLKIPEEFECDFNADKFKDCFKRVLADCKAWDYSGISGAYEHETLEMFIDAFNEAVILPKGHGRLIDADALPLNAIDDANYGSNYIRIAPTIIEADKENEDGTRNS
ncbi:MAG: hypothetical protein LIR46_07770 [Bacteroidota bacterium]|nr:hypothetical protein [Bacteroidota bacterium]